MFLPTVNSTNTYLKTHLADFDGQSFAEVWTTDQTAGRGQAGNSWESEPGQNVLLSVLYRNTLPVHDAFRLTMAVSLALTDIIPEATIKWPNDIYIGDRKLCGILIESAINGTFFDYSIIGIGLNINQTTWHSDAPNPISLAQARGHKEDIDHIHNQVITALHNRLNHLSDPHLKEDYMAHLYRKEGFYPYRNTSDGTFFEAQIQDVSPLGEFVLLHKDGTTHTYLLKQVQYIIQNLL